jgi:hypothetical protein
MAQAGSLQNALWDQARRAAEANPNPVPAGMFVQPTNDLIDSFGRRDAAINRHVPEVVLFLLLGTFLITCAIVGFSGGVVGRRPPLVSFAMVVLIVVLVFVILDLDSRFGPDRISENNTDTGIMKSEARRRGGRRFRLRDLRPATGGPACSRGASERHAERSDEHLVLGALNQKPPG